MTALFASARAPARWFAGLLGALGAAAAIIALLALVALTLLNVRQRELEIAAHRAVGARRRDIMGMILRSTLGTCIRGSLAGVILSIAVARAVQMVLPRMALFSWSVLALTASMLAAAALCAATIPARAAARIPPAQIHA
jgi:putative ABC transport system permease protein